MDMVDYLERERGIRVQRAGTLYRACCPFHNERTPSFYIDPRDGHGYCHGGCPEDKSYIRDVVEMIFRLEFPHDQNRARAFERARQIGAVVDNGPRPLAKSYQLPQATPEQVKAMTIAFTVYQEFFHRRVGVPARRWLFETRGLKGPLVDLALHTIGFAPQGGLYHSEVVERLEAELGDGWLDHATTTGILNIRGGQRLRNRIIFAIRDEKGNVIQYQGRSILSPEEIEERSIPKHLNAPGIRKAPYLPIPRDAAAHPGTCVDEGPMDALSDAVNGFFAYGLLGSRIPPTQTLRVLPGPIIGGLDNAPDENEAGPKGQRELRERCEEAGLSFVDGQPPREVKDNSEYLMLAGPEEYTRRRLWQLRLYLPQPPQPPTSPTSQANKIITPLQEALALALAA